MTQNRNAMERLTEAGVEFRRTPDDILRRVRWMSGTRFSRPSTTTIRPSRRSPTASWPMRSANVVARRILEPDWKAIADVYWAPGGLVERRHVRDGLHRSGLLTPSSSLIDKRQAWSLIRWALPRMAVGVRPGDLWRRQRFPFPLTIRRTDSLSGSRADDISNPIVRTTERGRSTPLRYGLGVSSPGSASP